MSKSSQINIEAHARAILNRSSKDRNKIHILCEGGTDEFLGTRMRFSPKSHLNDERVSDANFYKACVPDLRKRNGCPKFFNCGGRSNVIETYFAILKLYKELGRDDQEGALDPQKLFVLVDSDLEDQDFKRTLENKNYSFPVDYPFSSIDKIYQTLYFEGEVNQEKAGEHRIWVTGFIHKEAYFLEPVLQELFNELPQKPYFGNESLQLAKVYSLMCHDLSQDQDLKMNFERVKYRVQHCSGLDTKGVQEWKESWENQYSKAAKGSVQEYQLISALLIIRKAKEYWNQITSEDSEDELDSERFREGLSLQVVGRRFYAKQTDSQYHLPAFFRCLFEIEEKLQKGLSRSKWLDEFMSS